VASDYTKAVWFPKDMLLAALLSIPLFGLVGLGWGLTMSLFMAGPLIGWLFAGLVWGAFMWVFCSLLYMVMGREISTRVPLGEASTFQERLGKAVKRHTYVVEQESPTWLVCRPKYGLARFFECTKVHIILHDGVADLTGPAWVVKKVRKQLLEPSPPVTSPATTD
jgi:hypothetical protein